jgi:hypothetical protein
MVGRVTLEHLDHRGQVLGSVSQGIECGTEFVGTNAVEEQLSHGGGFTEGVEAVGQTGKQVYIRLRTNVRDGVFGDARMRQTPARGFGQAFPVIAFNGTSDQAGDDVL